MCELGVHVDNLKHFVEILFDYVGSSDCLQVDLIRQRVSRLGLSPSQLEVHTVDGFQGREKEAVIISFTRSNDQGHFRQLLRVYLLTCLTGTHSASVLCAGKFGFLREQRRTNVAVTRARRHLALVGDSGTISREPFISGLIDYCSTHGDVRTAHDYINGNLGDFMYAHPPGTLTCYAYLVCAF